jgi:hypothetical protein
MVKTTAKIMTAMDLSLNSELLDRSRISDVPIFEEDFTTVYIFA